MEIPRKYCKNSFEKFSQESYPWIYSEGYSKILESIFKWRQKFPTDVPRRIFAEILSMIVWSDFFWKSNGSFWNVINYLSSMILPRFSADLFEFIFIQSLWTHPKNPPEMPFSFLSEVHTRIPCRLRTRDVLKFHGKNIMLFFIFHYIHHYSSTCIHVISLHFLLGHLNKQMTNDINNLRFMRVFF